MKIHHGTLRETKIREYGLQSKIARRAHISQASLNYIWTGKRMATAEQAKKLEEAFTAYGFSLNRWDFLYGMKPDQGIVAYYESKLVKGV